MIRDRFQLFDLHALKTDNLQPVRCAVIDSGVDATHPHFSPIKSLLQFRCHGSHFETFAERRNNDDVGHGTAVLGIASSIAPNLDVLDLRVVGTGDGPTAPNLITALDYCIEHSVKLINLSLAVSRKYQRDVQKKCEEAQRKGLIILAAQRNFPMADHGIPAELGLPISINTASLDAPLALNYQAGRISPYVACGNNVEAPLLGGGYKKVSGTSFATPIVTGICAVFLGMDPDLESHELKTLLKWHSR